MNIEVQPDKIKYEFKLFSVIIPKNINLIFQLHNAGPDVGTNADHLITFNLISKDKKITPGYGKILFFLRNLLVGSVYSGSGTPYMSLLTVYGIQPIESLLIKLKNNGYNVDKEIAQLEIIKNTPVGSFGKKSKRI